MKSRTILVRGARQLLTLHGPAGPRRGRDLGDLGIIEDGSVLIVDGTVAAVGSTRRVENLTDAQDAVEIDATGRVVMPAFVDCCLDLLHPEREHTPGTPAADSAKALARARRTLNHCVRHGTGTIEVRCGGGGDEASDLRLLRSAARLDSPATIVPAYSVARGEGVLSPWVGESLLEQIERKQLARAAAISWGIGAVPAESALRCAHDCRRRGLIAKIDVAGGDGVSVPAALACGLATVEGLAEADDRDAGALARSNSIAVLMPARTFHRGSSRYAPARAIIDAGVPVALGSGFEQRGSATFSMQTVTTLAVSYLKMTPAEALSAATINGAYAAGLGARTGSLQFGKDADLVILNVSDYRDMFQQFGANLVEKVVKNGRVVYRESEVQ